MPKCSGLKCSNHVSSSVVDDQIVWFQYKIIRDILDTKHYLYKVKLITDKMCSFCNMHPETTLHLLSDCSYVVDLWTNILNWIRRKLNIYRYQTGKL